MATFFKKATVNASDVPSSLSNYPTYIDLSRIGVTTLQEAQSARFYADAAKTTEWAREIVSVSEAHVKIPSLTSTTDIYVDIDDSSADYAVTDTYGRNAVWSDYAAVLHLTTSNTDSTGNISSTDTSITYTTGKVGGGADFESTSSSSINMGDPASFDNTSNITIQVWLKAESFTNYGMVCAKGDLKSWEVRNFSTGGALESNFKGSAGSAPQNLTTRTSVLSTATWYMFHTTYDATTLKTYINGADDSNPTTSPGSGAIPATTDTAYIGRRSDGFYWDGVLDDWRLRRSTLTANWITTEYNNQNDEATFWGTWTTVSGGATPTPTLMMMGVGS